MKTINAWATELANLTGKHRQSFYTTLKTLLDKIEQEDIQSLSYNSDFSEVTLNGVRFFQDARKHWKRADVHQPIPVIKTVENKSYAATPVEQDYVSEEIIAQAARMMSFSIPNTKPIEKHDSYYIGERVQVAQEEDGTKYYTGGFKVEDTKDSCVDEPIVIATETCVYDIETYKQKLTDLYVSNGFPQHDSEVSASGQLNAFSVIFDPELTGTYEKVSDDSFLFNGKTAKFNEEDGEFQLQK